MADLMTTIKTLLASGVAEKDITDAIAKVKRDEVLDGYTTTLARAVDVVFKDVDLVIYFFGEVQISYDFWREIIPILLGELEEARETRDTTKLFLAMALLAKFGYERAKVELVR